MMKPAMRRLLAPMLILHAGAIGCGTVDLEDPPTDVNACRPSQSFFLNEVWPNFLAKDYAGKRCYNSGCHDRASGRPLTLDLPTSNPAVPLPPDWAAVYRSASEQVLCTNVAASPLLTNPDGREPHGGNKVLSDDEAGAALTLIKMWVVAPP